MKDLKELTLRELVERVDKYTPLRPIGDYEGTKAFIELKRRLPVLEAAVEVADMAVHYHDAWISGAESSPTSTEYFVRGVGQYSAAKEAERNAKR